MCCMLYVCTVLEVSMRVRLVKMRINGVEIDRRALREAFGCPGELVVMYVSDQGLRRPVKVARLMRDGKIKPS